jgi:hypothetical protein
LDLAWQNSAAALALSLQEEKDHCVTISEQQQLKWMKRQTKLNSKKIFSYEQ